MWPLPDKTPLNPLVHSRREHDGYSVENVALETMPGFFCTGNLYRPLKGALKKGPLTKESLKSPAVLCPHGHFQPLGRFREEHQIRCAHLARMGATVFSCSMVGWQDSTQTTHKDPLVLALQTWNSIRVIDFLTSLKGVDPDRVAVTGASGGGSQTLFVTLVDERVKVSAPVVIVYPWTERDGCLCEGGLPIMGPSQSNAIEMAAAIAPRPQLLISAGKNDPTHDFPKVGFPFIEHVYKVHGRADAAANVHLADEGHDYGPSKRRAMYEFFAKHLGLELKDETPKTIPIEPPEAMQVFDDKHPLPSHALRGEAVGRAFRGLARAKAPAADTKLGKIEASLFTPSGFDREGMPAVASGTGAGRVKIVVRDATTGKPTCCRINVVGQDGNFYQPAPNDLTPFALTGQWPRVGRGNREGKAPIRYYGRFFYSRGETSVDVPAGVARVEVWKGIEYRPQTLSTLVAAGETRTVEVKLNRSLAMAEEGYHAGDPHLHLKRETQADDDLILDLLEGEDVRFGSVLAYNEPAGPYAGFMEKMDTPQFRGLGEKSLRRRGAYQIMSGQEYRSSAYGHLNLYLRDDLVLRETTGNADFWPLYGDLGRQTQQKGGYAFYAHGGYAQAIYADLVHGNVNGVELLQFGVYRGIGLDDWYHVLSAGFRFPCFGASDYPACRKLGDCLTYIHDASTPTFAQWFRAAAEGRSFVSTGPLVLLEVDGQKPGSILRHEGAGPHKVTAHVRVLCEVAPVTHVQLIAGGKVVRELVVPADQGKGNWLEIKQTIELKSSSWIAARAFSQSPSGEPDAEAHTNPVYVYFKDRAPYDAASLEVLVQRIEGQIAVHAKRDFLQKVRVLDYFARARERLLKIRQAGGLTADEVPAVAAAQKPASPSSSPPSDKEGKRAAFDPSARSHTDAELREFLKPVPPLQAAQAAKTFQTVGGFRMQLVAAEPLVFNPVAAAFDEDGKLYVCELRDYPYLPKPGQKPLGAVRLLEDTNGDGTFDKSTVFADGLVWAAGVAPWKGGVFVAAPPDIWYLKDTDGDGKADVRQRIFTGFGTQNCQGMLNNLVFGLDHKIYGATSVNGGTVQPAGDDKAAAISVNGKDFRFDPATGRFETVTGTVQFGNTFDDWGNRFLCSESQPLLHAVLPQEYLARNPYLPVPSAIHNLAPAPVPIFRISPLERWRVIRSARRIAHGERAATMPGASHSVVDAAAGVTIYRGGAYPQEYYGQVFVGDAQNNLIHRRALLPAGPTFRSPRADNETEFVRSPDNWFRPVNFMNAPDGTLYVLDLSREILEAIHIPLDVVKFLDLTHGRDRGRIYRLSPPNFRYPGPPRLGKATGAELVAALQSPHGWWRDTAHRLIYERQDKSLSAALRRLVRQNLLPQARVHALWSLHGLGTIAEDDILAGLCDQAAGVRENALRLSEPLLSDSDKLRQRVLALADDPDARVRFQAAFSIGEAATPEAAAALARLARRDGENTWMRTAVLSSASHAAPRLFTELLSDLKFAGSPTGEAFLGPLALAVGARNKPEEVQGVLDAVAALGQQSRALQGHLVLSLGDGLKHAGARFPVASQEAGPGARLVLQLLGDSLLKAQDPKAPEAARLQAIRLLGSYPLERTRAALAALLEPSYGVSVQLAAVRSLADQPEAQVSGILLNGWGKYEPAVNEAVLTALLSREEWTLALLKAAEKQKAMVAQLDSTRRDLLLSHRKRAISELAQKLFRDKSDSRAKVIADYQPALKLSGDSRRGQAVFKKSCSACHKIGEEGFAVGPDISSGAQRDPSSLLLHILDPNQYVAPNYVQYSVLDKQGRVFTGLMAAETATSITLRRDNNAQDTILRHNVEEMISSNKSLMPEDMEKQLNPRDMADLLTYLLSVQTPPRLDIGTTPGMLEPDLPLR